jgi:hypothetical protein
LLGEGLFVAGAGQEPAVEREWVERTKESQAINDSTNKRIDRYHALGLQFAERNVDGPLIGASVVKALKGKVDALADAHSGVPHQQQDIGWEIIATEQFLLN